MNTGIFGEGFPYSNFHDLNMDWIIKIAKDFLDQYTHIQEVITAGEESLTNLTTSGLQQLQDKADALETLLQNWYNTHSEDIANQLASALADLNAWYTEHSQDISNELQSAKSNLDAYALQKLNQTLESIPDDYTELYNRAVRNTKYQDNQTSKLMGLQRNRVAYFSCDGMTLYRTGYYMYEDGTLVEAHSHNILVIRDRTIKQLTFPAMSSNISNLATCVVKYSTDVVQSYKWNTTQQTTITMPDTAFDAIYINHWNAETTPLYAGVDVIYNQGIASIQNLKSGFDIEVKPWAIPYGQTKTYKFLELTELLSGYVSTGDPSGSGAHKHILFPSIGVKSISLTSQSASGVAWAIYYPSLTRTGVALIGAGTGGTYTFDKPFVGYIGLNRFEKDDNSYAEEFTITYWAEEDLMPEMKYHTSVRKPFSFNGKTALFIGDSITQGYTSVGQITTENFPKLFSQAVGLTYDINASGGSCYTSNLNEVPTIPSKVANIDTTNPPDFVFIAGGTNDWQLNAGKQSFIGSISNMCNWINSHLPNTKFIFITPINACEELWKDAHTDLIGVGKLKTYADWLYEILKEKDNGNYSIVCGFEFGFPKDNYDSTYINAMLGDYLHPTERGYADLYVVGLLNALQ